MFSWIQEFKWNDTTTKILTDMWPRNSATQIAMALGTTRNSVIGKVHRLKLEAKASNPRNGDSKPRRSHKRREDGNKVFRLRRYTQSSSQERAMETDAPASLNIPFLELNDTTHCKEVTGTGEDGLASYCGHPRKEKSSYCWHCSARNEQLSIYSGKRRAA